MTTTKLISEITDLVTDLDPALLDGGEEVVIHYLAKASLTTLRMTYPPLDYALATCDAYTSLSEQNYCTRHAMTIAESIIRRILLDTGLIFLIRAATMLLRWLPGPVRSLIFDTIRSVKELASVLQDFELSAAWFKRFGGTAIRLASQAVAKVILAVQLLSEGAIVAARFVSEVATDAINFGVAFGKEVLDEALTLEAKAIADLISNNIWARGIGTSLLQGLSYLDGILRPLGLPSVKQLVATLAEGGVALFNEVADTLVTGVADALAGAGSMAADIISDISGGVSDVASDLADAVTPW